jgi:hypothetical protein
MSGLILLLWNLIGLKTDAMEDGDRRELASHVEANVRTVATDDHEVEKASTKERKSR